MMQHQFAIAYRPKALTVRNAWMTFVVAGAYSHRAGPRDRRACPPLHGDESQHRPTDRPGNKVKADNEIAQI